MADPLSIAGLAATVLEVSCAVYDYVSSVKSAKDDIRRLSQEMFALKGTLDHMIAFQQSGARDAGPPPQMEDIIKMTLETLEIIRRRLARRNKGVGKSVQILTWPFHRADIDNYVASLERAKTWFIMTLMQDNTEQTSAVYAEVRRLADVIHEDILSRQLAKMTWEAEETIRGLSPVNPAEDHLRVRRDLAPGTGGWFMDKAFEEWAEIPSSSRPMLWVNGKSGAGKTSLFSNVVEELGRRCSSRSDQSACCYFYCHSGDTASQLPVNIFGSLLAQLCRIRPDMLSQVRPLLKSDNHLIPQSPLSISDLVRLLTSVLDLIPRCYMLVDALNETPHARQIVSSLAKLCQTCTRLRVLVTSASNPPFEGKQILVRPMAGNAVDHDIGLYVDHRIKTEPSFSGLSDRIKTEIKLTMATGAHGMFRWAQLGMDRLCNLRTGRDVLMALADLPSTLNDTYALLLQRITSQDRNIALNAFEWLSFSIKILTLEQLAEAVVLQESDRHLEDDFRLTNPGSVIDICQGLIQLEDGYVVLAHDSVRTFLMSDWIRSSPVAEFALDQSTSNRRIMRKCLAYLSFDEFATGYREDMGELFERYRRYPLIDYAAVCWPGHAANTELEREDEQLIIDFFKTKELRRGGNFDSWVQILLGSVNIKSIHQTEPLYYAASYNMVPIVKLLLRQGSETDVNKPGGRFGSTAFGIACFRGHAEVAKLLLEAGADPNACDGGTGRSALSMARHRGMDDVVTLIRSHPQFRSESLDSRPWWASRTSGD